MGRRSSKDESEKSVYQKAREALDLTRDLASDLMVSVSPAQIEKIESGKQLPQAYDILQMAAAYKRPELCNYFCTHECEIGKKSVPEIQLNELPSIILETIASLNDTMPLTNRLIEITRDGKISNNEIPDFVKIKYYLDKVSLAVDELNLWIEKTIGDEEIDAKMLALEEEKIKMLALEEEKIKMLDKKDNK